MLTISTASSTNFRGFLSCTTRRERRLRDIVITTGLVIAGALSAVASTEQTAHACGGGAFLPPTERTVVTDHRVVVSLSRERTVLWDQMRYEGSPRDFAWVLPVREGTRLELAKSRWLTALEAVTQPEISAPSPPSGGGGGLGCGSVGAAPRGDSAERQVTTVNEAVVGPYEMVTVRAEDPSALEAWLVERGYHVPDGVRPALRAYVASGFQFMALRLRPNEGVQALRPVRVVIPGTEVTLPLRMAVAGAGKSVGLTLFVLGEGRYAPQNFPTASIDFSRLVWDYAQSRSNYQSLSLDAMARESGRSWVTEFSNRVTTTRLADDYVPESDPSLADAYYRGCVGSLPRAPSSGVAKDAAPDDDTSCASHDDLIEATAGMRAPIWLTRLRANLPVTTLTEDLRLAAAAEQTPVDHRHTAKDPAEGQASVSPAVAAATSRTMVGATTIALLALLMRKRHALRRARSK